MMSKIDTIKGEFEKYISNKYLVDIYDNNINKPDLEKSILNSTPVISIISNDEKLKNLLHILIFEHSFNKFIDEEYSTILQLYNCISAYYADKIDYSSFWLLQHKVTLLKLYWQIIHNNIFYLYGSQYVHFMKIDNFNVHIFGEVHYYNACNVPANCIYMYELFETLIEYYLKTTKSKIHIFLESGYKKFTQKYTEVDIRFLPIENVFLPDASDVYYYFNLCRKYLIYKLYDLDDNREIESILNKKSSMERMLNKYNGSFGEISNFTTNFLDRIEFHYTDSRELYRHIINKANLPTVEKFYDNYLIFPEKVWQNQEFDEKKWQLNTNSTISIQEYIYNLLDPIMESDKSKTVYRTLYDELISVGYIKQEDMFNIDKCFTELTKDAPIMDHLSILKFMYIDYMDKDKTILFHGGSAHSNHYSTWMRSFFKNRYIIHKDILTDKYQDDYGIPFNMISCITELNDIFVGFPEVKKYLDNKKDIYASMPITDSNYLLQLKDDYSVDKYYPDDNETYPINVLRDNFMIDTWFLEKCKSKLTDNVKLGGYDKRQQIFMPLQKKLNSLEKVELAELNFMFKDVDIIASIENLLESVNLNRKNHENNFDYPLEEDHTGGMIFRNKWLKFLLM